MLRKRGSGRRQDEGADSGAETGGSEYSRVSTSSSELSLEDVEDPFLVSIHIIADPGESRALQQAIDSLLAWIHPDLQLFRVSERRIPRKPRKSGGQATASQPALAVILFLQEEYDEEPILQLHESFRRPPWRFHHTERVHGNFLPYMPGSQDFFTLAQGTPLWAIRPVHYGKEIIRFTIYCRNENFVDIMRMYELILKRRVCQKKADFCVFPVYSNVDIDIQFSLKRLPGGHVPSPTESAVLEFRVKDIGQLVPLLPNPCSPISEGRWQTEDLDGNKILLQQTWYKKSVKQNRFCQSSKKLPVASLPSAVPHSGRSIPNKTSNPSRPVNSTTFHLASQCFRLSHQDLRNYHQEHFCGRSSSGSIRSGSFQRSKSLVCLPTSSPLALESFHFSEPNSLSTFSSGHSTRTRVNIDDLEGVQETDVDTGMKLAFSDLSVVSAYSVPYGFSKNMEGRTKCVTREWSVNRFKQAGLRGRSHTAKCSSLCDSSSSSLPFHFHWSSGSSASPSASPSAPHVEIKWLPRGTFFTFDDSRTTGGGKTNEEEFYI
ncbi:protein FAM124A isoform X1 [Hemicordylus capensis]|uniref:protein FAM124A isoform X1 n=1 Tax=Hemicordylus capensis TaxID=884348 RepID=UPI0023030CBA|nr:protein FAM124A isoform X1 [Hemicordylus capensis]